MPIFSFFSQNHSQTRRKTANP